MGYYVRSMRKEDVPQVNEIDREAFPTQWPPPNYGHEMDNQFAHYIVACDDAKTIETPRPSPNSLQEFTSRIRRWFNRDGGETPAVQPDRHYIIGFAGIWIMANESHLTNIAVRASYQRQGIGELLLISIVELSMQLRADIVTLEVRVSNSPAQSLYTKYGFAQVGLRRAYYTDNREDAFLMSTSSLASEAYREKFQQLKQAYFQKWGEASRQISVPRSQPDRI